jgi:hypothetical protein
MSLRSARFARALSVAVVLTLSPASVLAEVRPTPGTLLCRRVELTVRPTWSFSGEWVRDGSELVLTDVLEGRLLRFDRNGAYLGSAGRPGRGPKEFFRPLLIRNAAQDVVLLDTKERVFGLERNLEPKWEVRLLDLAFPTGDRVAHLSSFIVTDKGLLGLVLVIDETGHERWFGIGRLRLRGSPAMERLQALPSVLSPDGDLYGNHGGPYFAEAAGGTYALFFEGDPHIAKIIPKRHRLASFPEGYRSPVLPRNTGRSSGAAWYRGWELSTAPVALHSRGDSLYLLARKPDGSGGTLWRLYQIDPVRDRIVRSIVLPTRASHVVVVPGPVDWAIVEKGPVVANGMDTEQVIGSMVLVPAGRIESRSTSGDLSKCVSSGE